MSTRTVTMQIIRLAPGEFTRPWAPIAQPVAAAQHLLNADPVAGLGPFRPANPTGHRHAAQMLTGLGRYLQVADVLVGYGRKEGYDSLANARRAAYMLSRGDARPAAGVFEQGSRWYVRAMGTLPRDASQPLQLLHIEGNPFARITGVADPRLALIVDGSTRVFARDL